MKKIFTFAAALLFGMSMMATELFSFTVTSETVAIGSYASGAAVLSGSTMPTGGSNEVTVGSQTFYKFNTSTKWTFTMDEALQAGDVIDLLVASHATSNKNGKGVKLNDITLTAATIPAGEAVTISYTVTAGDAIDGSTVLELMRADSDIKFGTITVTGERGSVTTKYTVTYKNGETTLGTERVVEGETPAKYGDYQTVAGSAFEGWYNEADFQTEADFTAAITADKTFYGKFTHVASSENLLKELWFSNEVKAYIVRVDSTNIATVKGCYMAGTAAPTIKSNIVSDGASFAQNGNTITVTAENGDTKDYALELTEVTPLSTFTSGEAITFDGTEVEADGYIYSVYGWDENKGIKWGKPLDEAKNMRIREGKNRVYMFLPACDSVAFIGGSGGARDVEIRVNGVVNEVVKTPASGAQIIVKGFNAETANMISFESNGKTNGDSGFTGMIIYNSNTPTSINNIEAAKAVKVIENGQIVIIKNGVRYNAVGAKL